MNGDNPGDLRANLRQAERLLGQMLEQRKREKELQAESKARLRQLEQRIANHMGYIQGLRKGLGLPPPEFAK